MARDVFSGAAPRCDSIPELLHLLGRAEAYELIQELARGPAQTGELAAALELDYSSISGKLGTLRAAGLVNYRQIKKFHVYSLTKMVKVDREGSAIALTFSLASGERMTLQYPPTSSNNHSLSK